MSEQVDKYEMAVRRWVQRKENLPEGAVAYISDVQFATIQTGYCETCAGSSNGVEYSYKEPRKSVVYKEIITEGMMAADFFRECAAIIEESQP